MRQGAGADGAVAWFVVLARMEFLLRNQNELKEVSEKYLSPNKWQNIGNQAREISAFWLWKEVDMTPNANMETKREKELNWKWTRFKD